MVTLTASSQLELWEQMGKTYTGISGEGVEQCFRVPQILRLKAFGKPVVDFR
jgi:hypothetical protein